MWPMCQSYAVREFAVMNVLVAKLAANCLRTLRHLEHYKIQFEMLYGFDMKMLFNVNIRTVLILVPQKLVIFY